MKNVPISLSAKVIVHDSRGRVLLLKRAPASKGNPGKWEFPGGKVQPGEDFYRALLREIKEETGISVDLTRSFGTCESRLNTRQVIYLVMEAKGRSTTIRLSREHDKYKWV